MKNPQVYRVVGPETVRILELGHPWVVADSFTKKWPTGGCGEVVHLHDPQKRFLATALLDPTERVVARVLDHAPIQITKAWLLQRCQSAIRLRQQLALTDSTAYRLINAEGDFLPGVTVDRYGDYLLVQLYSKAWQPHLKLLTDVLQELLSPRGIYEKHRPQNTRQLAANADTKKYGTLLTGKAAPQSLAVKENGLTFLVQLEQGLHTGLFLDQRSNRRDLMQRVAGKRVLNLFSYTGAFSVAAAAGGARHVTSIDASGRYNEMARENFSANGLDLRNHGFITGDCLTELGTLTQRSAPFDIILMDPPSFSTTAQNRFTTRGGTADLVAAALPLLSAHGLLIASSNHQKVDTADYLKELRRGALLGGADLRIISLRGQGEDFPYPLTFPEGRYLKYAIGVKSDCPPPVADKKRRT